VNFAATDAHFDADEQRVWADPQRLEQVLVNLLINAIDALAERCDKRIEITVGAVGAPVKQVCITLRDSGAGIPPSVMAHLFEPFFTTKAAGQGLGLGLPISRLIINELGGRIEAGNHPCGGAQFSVFLEAA
jgi:two-component system C4-dicarboxylate transport sensor histidine kinase DctB